MNYISQEPGISLRELKLLAENEVLRTQLRKAQSNEQSRLLRTAKTISKNLQTGLKKPKADSPALAIIRESNLFNPLFYVHRYPEILDTGLEPIEHFVLYGASERKDPSGLFDSSYYLSQVGTSDAIENLLVHYIETGASKLLNPNRLFDAKYYVKQFPEAKSNPLKHFVTKWKQIQRSPSALFDLRYYLACNQDVAATTINPLEHYLISGAFEGRNPEIIFDSRFYSSQRGLPVRPPFPLENTEESQEQFYAQAAYFLNGKTVLNPLFDYLDEGNTLNFKPHPLFDADFYKRQGLIEKSSRTAFEDYLLFGRKKNRAVHPLFDPVFYFAENMDVLESGSDALTHFLTIGALEKRSPCSAFDARFYLGKYPDVKEAGVNPLIHFLQSGVREKRKPHANFDMSFYCERYMSDAPSDLNPLIHYVLEGKAAGNFTRAEDVVENVTLEDVVPKSIQFPHHDRVAVSIVIPSYKQNDFTLRCLQSLAKHHSRYQFEVVVVDDCSPDDTQEKLENIDGLRYFRNEVNQGFVMTCNRGAREAKGEFVVFLNNDTLVLDSWLDELIDTFYEHPRAGLVGSKLIYPDGALQDAGGIVYSDGDAANFGRDDISSKPEYNYVRSVDYCTGAALAMRREHFIKLGSFGEDYRPIYWEDVDLAFKVRADGWDCLYQPFSTVIHFEGVTCGRNTSTGLKQSQVTNQKKFGATWAAELSKQPQHTNKPFIEWNRSSKKKVLFVTVLTPRANRDAGSTLTIEWLKTFKDCDYDVTFFPTSLEHDGIYTEYLQKQGIKCIYTPYPKSVDEFVASLKDEYDLVVICRFETFEQCYQGIKERCPSAKYVFQTIDLHYLRTQRMAEITASASLLQQAEDIKQKELEAIKSADMSIVVSSHEIDVLEQELEKPRVVCIPFSTELNRADTSFTERRDIVFVGGYNHAPNVDAVCYFAKQVFPLVKKTLPDLRFFIIGGGVTPEVQQLANFDVVVTGMVEDLSTYLSFAKLSVAPIRFGAGLKGKILSSLGAGLPCVTSTVGIEGTGLTDGVNILVGNSAEQFAEQIITLYQNEGLWNELASSGYDFVKSNFSAQEISRQIIELMTVIGVDQNTKSTVKNNSVGALR